jgi:hypothetical protein
MINTKSGIGFRIGIAAALLALGTTAASAGHVIYRHGPHKHAPARQHDWSHKSARPNGIVTRHANDRVLKRKPLHKVPAVKRREPQPTHPRLRAPDMSKVRSRSKRLRTDCKFKRVCVAWAKGAPGTFSGGCTRYARRMVCPPKLH